MIGRGFVVGFVKVGRERPLVPVPGEWAGTYKRGQRGEGGRGAAVEKPI